MYIFHKTLKFPHLEGNYATKILNVPLKRACFMSNGATYETDYEFVLGDDDAKQLITELTEVQNEFNMLAKELADKFSLKRDAILSKYKPIT